MDSPVRTAEAVRHETKRAAQMSRLNILSSWRDVMADAVRGDSPDLSMRQWAILLTVYLNPGPHTVRNLSRDLNVPKPAISRALDALSILGFIRRIRDEDDRRIVIVQKTPSGAMFVDDFARIVEERGETPMVSTALYG
jgi:DNA-binding MarR family transcriptional regulator